MEVSTIKIKSTDPKSQGPYIVINESDFDPSKHTKYEDKSTPQPSDAAIADTEAAASVRQQPAAESETSTQKTAKPRLGAKH